jgi:hypothetical protein
MQVIRVTVVERHRDDWAAKALALKERNQISSRLDVTERPEDSELRCEAVGPDTQPEWVLGGIGDR